MQGNPILMRTALLYELIIMKADHHNTELLDSILTSITPEEQAHTDLKMLLAAKIHHAMKAKGWDQQVFAIESGKNTSEISKWLSGTHTFTSDLLWMIGDMLEVDLLRVAGNK
jgi:glycine cleavage system H lipoate-binding protein